MTLSIGLSCMKIFYSSYTLKGERGFGDRQGALLRFAFEDGKLGYADCHPWVGLGDLSLEQQLSLLSQGLLSKLTKRSLLFAKIDAEARLKGINLFSQMVIPPSHWLISIPGEEIPEQFTRIKLKVGHNPSHALSVFNSLPCHVKVRLDFNGKLSHRDFKACIESMEAWTHRIDFIEDPFPYNSQLWNNIQQCYGVTLACDHRSELRLRNGNSHSISVLKPAIQDERIFLHKEGLMHRLVVTSYLDHPLGQLAAAYIAAQLSSQFTDKMDICGLASHTVYHTNVFSEQLQMQGAVLIPPEGGTGFGFDDILEKQNWKQLYTRF